MSADPFRCVPVVIHRAAELVAVYNANDVLSHYLLRSKGKGFTVADFRTKDEALSFAEACVDALRARVVAGQQGEQR